MTPNEKARPTRFGKPETDWQTLVRLYADGRTPCNCGDAYRDAQDGCPGGCSSAQISTKGEIAKRVIADLKGRP